MPAHSCHARAPRGGVVDAVASQLLASVPEDEATVLRAQFSPDGRTPGGEHGQIRRLKRAARPAPARPPARKACFASRHAENPQHHVHGLGHCRNACHPRCASCPNAPDMAFAKWPVARQEAPRAVYEMHTRCTRGSLAGPDPAAAPPTQPRQHRRTGCGGAAVAPGRDHGEAPMLIRSTWDTHRGITGQTPEARPDVAGAPGVESRSRGGRITA